ncbi:hypothetical protein TEA_014657 [Camellia sinensis var. sinensis]|uniref:Gamma-tubulin complex component n=1 Tax=Camellia sinensis var. sinensis TaxID=542762 RepID=A0A4S4D9M7_CAMSN|nr:hypothetical protein TEA_014657 [Camellia sinensis var. sinensis]
MAVDTNFASLFEKLKLEDPWLPPRPWESIPSESGFSHSNNSTSQSSLSTPLYDTPIVSEASLVRLAMNALQGIESALITIENLCAAFCSDPADRTFHRIPSLWKRSSSTLALGKILKSIGRSGCVVFILHKFVDHFKNFNFDESLSCSKLMNSEAEENHNDRKGEGGEHHPYSLVNQAFSVAVQKVLEGYICTLDTLFASVGLRRSSKTVEVTLLEVYLHTKELRSQIEAIGNICNIHNIALCFSVADPAHTALLKFLFLCSCEPYCEFIRSWIYKAKISDPYKEFVMEYVENTPYPPGKAGSFSDIRLATIRERDGVAVPCFLKDFSIPLVRAGQQLQVLMKLLELCSHIGTVNHTYEDILPCWSGFSSDHPYYASPLTFNQGSIEAMVLARNDYYKRMLEKLDTILTKLEIRYQQVVADDSVPVFVNNNGGNLNNPISFMKDGSFIFPSTDKTDLDVAFNTMESEASSTTDEFSYVEDQLESSECSSLNGSEEKNESVQLIQLPNSLVVFEQNYLSALNLLSRTSIHNLSQKPSESDTSNHIEADSCEIYERTDLDDHSVHPCRRETNLSENPVCLDSGKPNWSWLSETQYTESQFDTGLLFSGLVKNPFFVDRRPRHDTRSHPSEHGLKASTRNTGVLKEGAPYLSNMILTENSLAEETNDNGQLPNRTCASSSSFTLQPLKLNYHSNLLSMNPLLSKNELMSRRGERWCRDRTEPFPCFDFSSVKDPYKVYVENLVPSPRCQFEADPMIFKNSNASAATCKSNHHNKEGYDGHEILIDKTEFAHVNLTLESKNDKKEDVILENVSGGSGWQSMLSCSDNAHNFSSRDHRNSLAALFEMPLDFVIEKCLLQEILLHTRYRYVSKLTIKLLEEGFDLQEHLLALRRYHFMELADWADLFIMSLWHHKWYVTEAERKVSEIQGLLEMSVQRSSCERDHYKDRLFVYMKGNGNGMMPLSTSTIGVDSFDFLGLGYRVDWPVSIVLTPGALKIYAQIFSFLIRVKLAVFSLTDVWCSLKDLLHFVNENRHSEVHEPEMRHFNILMRVRHQVNHFVSTLQQYVQSQLSHVSWCRFLDCLKHKVKDMMDLKSVHMAYLTDSLHICFLSDELQSIASIIENILQCALEFRACLIGSMYDAGLDGNFSDKLSRINISQVLAIKRTFDKNLKELHLCYLKTPKHREFALSHFWSYLNFNEYYSDVSNETSHYAFSV